MINMFEVNETNNMITQDKLDVRTITMGISLLDCIDSSVEKVCENVYNKITTLAKNLVSTGKDIEKEYGIPIVNKRISVTPIALVGSAACKTTDDFVEIAKSLDRAAKEVGVNFLGGYSALVSKGMTKAEELLIRSIPKALAVTERVCSSVNIGSTKTGINMDAVCSIMRADGTILGRKFISFSSDKDHLYHVLGRIRRFQREHSSRQVQSRWDYAKRLNMELSRKIAAEITKYAAEYRADIIVFEHLEMQGKIFGKKKQKLHLWRKRDIQKLCEHQAHRNGIRVSRVSARNTSRLACDGSGVVVRNPENHSLCTFRTGKQYNCDLSASYNIGSRYFIRELLKPLPETERSSLEAKVPAVKRRTSCVYADLRKLYVEVNNLKAA